MKALAFVIGIAAIAHSPEQAASTAGEPLPPLTKPFPSLRDATGSPLSGHATPVEPTGDRAMPEPPAVPAASASQSY
jgi:hypothetical protein